MSGSSSNRNEWTQLINRVLRGDERALADLFAEFRPRLWRMVTFRLHPRLQGRIDPDDVLQEAWIRATQRISSFITDASQSCYVWFRMIVQQTLIDLERRHVRAERRSANREVSIGGFSGNSTSLSIAHLLLGGLTSPSEAALRAELSEELDAAMKTLSNLDREVLALRHFEELSNGETAQVLDLTEQAASVRYVRALHRLKHVLRRLPSFGDAFASDSAGTR